MNFSFHFFYQGFANYFEICIQHVAFAVDTIIQTVNYW